MYRFLSNRQPGKALPYVLRLRRPNVFDLIREHNLLTDVQDQALLLVEFDQELVKQRREAGENEGQDDKGRSPAIALLVDHTFSIPVSTVLFIELPKLMSHFCALRIRFLALCNNYKAGHISSICTSTHYLRRTLILHRNTQMTRFSFMQSLLRIDSSISFEPATTTVLSGYAFIFFYRAS